MARPYTDEYLQIVADTLAAHGGNRAAAARALKVPASTLYTAKMRASERGFLSDHSILPGYIIKGMSQTFDAKGNIRSTSVRQAKEPGEVFQAPAGHLVAGVSALLDAEDRVISRWVKTREGAIGNGLVEALQEAFSGFAGQAPIILPPAEIDPGCVNFVPVTDLHYTMKCWGELTGDDWNLEAASTAVRSAMRDLFARMPKGRKCLIGFLGDNFHQNDPSNRTPKSGHRLDVDGRYDEGLFAVAELALYIIGLALQTHEEVDVVFVPGNHDPDATTALLVATRLYYLGRGQRVSIDPLVRDLAYREYGTNLLALHHGDKMQAGRMAHAMAADMPEAWGRTTCRRFFSGHWHREAERTEGAVKCFSLGTIAPNSSHGFAGGWRAERIMRAFHFHYERGETGTTSVFVR